MRNNKGQFKKGHKPTYLKNGKEHSRHKHGLCGTPIYVKWYSIKARCYNKNNDSYKNYGARGITVCDKWLNFEGFYDDMFPTYKQGLTIERMDNNGNYCWSNCKWIPNNEQSRNRHNVTLYEYEDKKLNIAEWEKEFGFKKNTLRIRIKNLGWPKAIEKQIRVYSKKK